MKKVYVSLLLLICLLFAMALPSVAEGVSGEEKFNGREDQSTSTEKVSNPVNRKSEDEQRIKDLLRDEDDIQYYAYLDLDDADPELVPVIIEARNTIIFRQSWVADGLQGFVCDRYGNLIEGVPRFSELFPEDWSVPILPTRVDLSYYK